MFSWPIRVYYSDTDAGGVVYHGSYLNFFEHARTEMLRSVGYQQSHDNSQSWMFVVADLSIKYRKPAKLNQSLVVVTEITQARGVSLEFTQTLIDDANTEYCQTVVTVVCVDCQHFRPCRIPQPIRKELMRAR
ncbi:tol-pal system-associated acyl-CoA thioesterase [Ferrimonas lipolytica]|uniref:Tol-pal system-associated acyl-CoA thioesterase n=1 Tax=Ferrimonas lipolytica TaxID=2724191 RepID=A0A6H1UIG2_9GAMM|nr:tol-pal system-associated acyl-CoA thioesterase [Ferrimonas lipolytica]